MSYADNPVRPRLQFWFGPLSMLCYLSDNNSVRRLRATGCRAPRHEAHCWQLKAGVNSALTDIQKNHPNDWVAMIFFSGLQSYETERVFLGRDYATMKNALFFPFNTLANLSDPNCRGPALRQQLQRHGRGQHPQRQQQHQPRRRLHARLQPVLLRAPATTAGSGRRRW